MIVEQYAVVVEHAIRVIESHAFRIAGVLRAGFLLP
jgi:hypothetical protein